MKVKNKKIVIGIITSLVLVSSISVLAPIIVHYANSYSKNSLLLTAANNYSTRKLSDREYSESTNTLINNLTYINKYINSTLIVKEKLLKLSILGGKYDNSKKYKDDKNRKMSELARFSHTLKHVHRYGDQARATIDNSTTSLNKESSVISQIIPIIKDHPYTYNSYLNEMKISIPNISFFINNDLSSSNNLNSKTSDISNSSYGINKNNTNLNSIAFSSEEDSFNAKTIHTASSSIYAAVSKKITFQAHIITFDKTSNSFKYETPTAKENFTSKIPTKPQSGLKNVEIISGNSLKTNNSSYFNSSRAVLSDLNSLSNTPLPTPLNPTYLPNYFKKSLANAAEARVRYNQISSFRNNYSIYLPAIILGLPGLVITSGIAIAHITVGIKTKKLQSKYSKDFTPRLDQLASDVTNDHIATITNDNFREFVDGINNSFTDLKLDVKTIPLKKSDRRRISSRIHSIEAIYNNNTQARKAKLVIADAENQPLADSAGDNHRILNELVQSQKENKAKIQNMIAEYDTKKIGDDMDNINTTEDLTVYVQETTRLFDEQLNNIASVNGYVNPADSSSLCNDIQTVIDKINGMSMARRAIINAHSRIRRDDEIRSKQENKESSQADIDNIRTEIIALNDIKDEVKLTESAKATNDKIHTTIGSITDEKYNTPEEAKVLKDQAIELSDSLSQKVDAIRTQIRDTNRASAEAEIEAHRVRITKLNQIDNRDELHASAKELSNDINGILDSVNSRIYSGPGVQADLQFNAKYLDELIKKTVSDQESVIENATLLRDTFESI